MNKSDTTIRPVSKRRYFIAGIVTLIPLWITWLLISFLFKTLSAVGKPFVGWLSQLIRPQLPALDSLMTNTVFQAILSFLVVIAFIYGLGVLTTVVIGRRLVAFFESLLDRVPFVKDVYGAVKKLTTVLQEKPDSGLQRVVLIDFPSPEMKTVGLVTRVMEDSTTGRKVAAVYVPTTPNPTSGYLEIVPVERLTPTEWTMDEAMGFIVSGGAIAPKTMNYDRPAAVAPEDLQS
ncbi:MAG: putative membrane protein [Verrucomicrobiales bacterium]|jgi:uncharacterized membrane protein